MCPCIRETSARPGTYAVSLRGKRAADAPPAGNPLAYDGRLDERSADCEAKAIFRLKPGTRVDLKLICAQ